MSTGIISYGAGNARSVLFALERLGADAFISDDAARLSEADRLILPGVGAADSAMQALHDRELVGFIGACRKPFLGICLGMQLLCERSEEGDQPCLGIFKTEVLRFRGGQKVPHTGWNTLETAQGKLFAGIGRNAFVYYVHSYYAGLCDSTSAQTSYIRPFSAALQRDNFFGVQFHPEKSGAAGERLLQNFLMI